MKKILALVFLLLLATSLVFAAPMIGTKTKTIAVAKPVAIAQQATVNSESATVEKPAMANSESATVEKPTNVEAAPSTTKKSKSVKKTGPTKAVIKECKGDMDGNGRVDFLDIVPFRKAFLDPSFSVESFWKLNCHEDNLIDSNDLNAFVALIGKPAKCRTGPVSLPAEKSDLAVKASSTENATEECKGDMDGNGRVDFLDIVPFRDALGLVNGTGQYTWIADCNHDFNATTEDINCFVDNLLGKPVTECRLIQRTIAIPDCKGDINGDGIVSFLDITPFTTFVYSEDYSWNADYDNNDDVDMADLNLFVEALMHPPEHPVCR